MRKTQALVSEGKFVSLFGFQGAEHSASKNQFRAQRSGSELKRKHNEMSELSPKVEAKDMEFVLTRCAFSSVGRATDS